MAAVLAVAAGVGVARRSTAAELDASVQRGPSAALAVESPEVERGRAPPASVGNSEEKEDGGMASALGAKFPVEVPATAPIGNDPDVALVEAPVPEPARSVMARDVAKPEVALPAAPTEQPANHATERGVESTTRMRGGALDVVVEPRGAYVSLDGQLPVHAPVKFDDVRPGAHVLRFGLVAGELGIERRVRVRSGQASTVQVKIANPFDEQG